MNPEANYDVSVDYNILNDAITAKKKDMEMRRRKWLSDVATAA